MRAASVLLLLLLAACAGRPALDAGRAPSFEPTSGGYATAEHGPVTSTALSWRTSSEALDLVLAMPSTSGALPVVVYLPGLGEPSAAGEHWRAAWASAGYAVLSVQLLNEDATAWTSELARNGDFKALARQRYSAVYLDRRLQMLTELVAEAKRRAAAGQAPWQRLDWNRAALAGFDLGAFTSMRVAGESVPGAQVPMGDLKFRAVIALSPFASASPVAATDRYGRIDGPVLTITSNADDDLLGLVDEPALRELPYAQMPAPDKYLLVVRGLPHAALGGNAEVVFTKATPPKRQSNGGGKGRRGGKADDAESSAYDAFRDDPGPDQPAMSSEVMQRRQSAAQTLATAFLDAYVKSDGRAREWLTSDLRPWLGASGELRRK